MKKMKKILMLVFCIMLVQAAFGSLGTAKTVEAATTKNGLVQSNGNYYYYKDGKKVTNSWVGKVYVGKDSKGNKIYKKMYFGSKGAAYKANDGLFVAKKIGTKYYGFTQKGYLVSKGLYVAKKSENFYYFNADGTRNASISNALNKAAVYGQSAAKLRSLLKKYNVVLRGTKSSYTCDFDPKYGGGKDFTYTYTYFRLGTTKDKDGKNEKFMYAESR